MDTATVTKSTSANGQHHAPHLIDYHGEAWYRHHGEHHDERFFTKYVFSTDHKMIARQFLITGIIMAVIGMLLSLAFRLQLAFPNDSFPILETVFGKWAPGGKLDPHFYLSLITIHGTILVFSVLTGGLSGTFINLLAPLQIGARDMASGFLNMLSYWFFFLFNVILLASMFVDTGAASAGWTVYPPLSALPQAIPGSGLGMTLWLVSMVCFIVSVLLGGINYVVTIINLRTNGMSMMRLPLTIWSFFVTAILGILSFPVLVAGALLLLMDRSFGTSFYLSDIFIAGEALPQTGGSPLLFQHLFWFLGHPEVYIILLPALGIACEVIAVNARKPFFGYKTMVGCLITIMSLSLLVWGHHMFVTGMNPFLGSIFVLTTLLVGVPLSVAVFNYIATLWKAKIEFTPAMTFAIGFVSLFISGGLTGLILGDSSLDINLHDNYFIVAHFHIVMGSAAFFGMFAGVYHWFPKLFGRMMNKTMGYIHFWSTMICVYGVFFPMHFMGLAGVPRRYYNFSAYETFSVFDNMNVVITIFSFIAGVAQLIFIFNFFYSIFRGDRAPQNPWNANTLEWTTPTEPIHGNWPGAIPSVHRWAYDYSKPGAKEDFIPQSIPLSETTESNSAGEG